jgi:hypothetical protein
MRRVLTILAWTAVLGFAFAVVTLVFFAGVPYPDGEHGGELYPPGIRRELEPFAVPMILGGAAVAVGAAVGVGIELVRRLKVARHGPRTGS